MQGQINHLFGKIHVLEETNMYFVNKLDMVEHILDDTSRDHKKVLAIKRILQTQYCFDQCLNNRGELSNSFDIVSSFITDNGLLSENNKIKVITDKFAYFDLLLSDNEIIFNWKLRDRKAHV